MNQMIARKKGMTQVFDTDGNAVPVTALEAGPFIVVQKKEKEAIQVGFLPAKEKRVNQPLQGHFKKAGVSLFRILKEIKFEKSADVNVGQELKVNEFFKAGEFVDVTGQSKGKGFQGTMKRHNYSGGGASHGSMSHRRPAAAGETESAKVYRGKRSPGHMGDERVTVQGLEIMGVMPEQNIMLVKGAVPGASGTIVWLRTSVKNAKKIKRKKTAKAAAEAQEAPAKEKAKGKGKK